jgi:sec-independent protein translocase protein TatC
MRPPSRLQHGEEATLVEHLGELRARIFISLLVVVVIFGVAYGFHEDLIRLLTNRLPDDVDHRLITLSPLEPFIVSFTVSFFAAIVGAMPIIMWQAWAFLAPAFSDRTQRSIVGLVVFAALLAAGGLAFGYFIVLPAALEFLTNYDTDVFRQDLRAREYLSFAVLVLMSVVVVFEVPIFVLGLVRVGVLTPRKLRRSRRVGYVLMAGLAVALPGVDPITTTLEMIPLMILYEGSIWLSWALDKRWRPGRYADVALDEPR